METTSALSIATAGDGYWLVTLDMRMQESERININLRIPVQKQPSPTVTDVEYQVLQRAVSILQQAMGKTD